MFLRQLTHITFPGMSYILRIKSHGAARATCIPEVPEEFLKFAKLPEVPEGSVPRAAPEPLKKRALGRHVARKKKKLLSVHKTICEYHLIKRDGHCVVSEDPIVDLAFLKHSC